MTVQPPLTDPTTSIPPRTALLTNITHQTALLQQLFTSLSAPITNAATSSTPAAQTIPQVYDTLSRYTEEMRSLPTGLWEHQVAYRMMKEKEEEVRRLEGRVRDLLRTLEEGRRELESVILDARGEEGGELKGSIAVSTLFSHARLLAKHSSAPTSHHMPAFEKGLYKPWPTENVMRQGILFIEGGGALPGLGDVEEQVPREVAHVPVVRDIEIQEERRERRNVPAIFNLDLNSDSEGED